LRKVVTTDWQLLGVLRLR